MKKLLILALVPLFFAACGGSGGTAATEEEAYVVASQFVDPMVGALPSGTSMGVNSMEVHSNVSSYGTYQTEVPYNWTAQSCITSGTYAFEGTHWYNDTSAMGSWRYSYKVTLNNCAGPDLLCNTGKMFTLNGTPQVTYEYRADTNRYTITFTGDYSYSGALNGTCTMNLTLSFNETPETGAVSYSGSSGTMCGYDVSTIQAMEDSGVEYCEVLSAASAE